MITKKQVEEVLEKLENSQNPVFLFDDDPDGLCSFLLLYRMVQKGYGIVIKNSPKLTKETYAEKVEKYSPDLIVILDKPMVEEEFIDYFNCPIIWIDHHQLQTVKKKVLYINPLQNGISTPTTYQCWEIVKNKMPQDIWIALLGIVGDWYYPKEIVDEVKVKYPGMIPSKSKTAPDILFMDNSKAGMLVKMLHFNLKGKIKDSEKNFKVLCRVTSPEEILYNLTPKGKFLMRNYSKINEEYEKVKKDAIQMASDDPFLVAIINQDKFSFSAELSNEVFYIYPEKIIILL